MSAQQKNLLEAFRSAGGAPQPPPPKPPPAKPPPPRPPAPPAASGAPRRAPAWLPWAAAIGVAFVLGVVVGRSAARVSEAAPSDGGSAADSAGLVAPVQHEGAEGARPGGTAEAPAQPAAGRGEDALLDPANQYTVIAAVYGRGKTDFAWATHDQMKDAGLPVFTPWQRERDILVLVGAAPTREGLRELEGRLRALDGWDGAKDAYADAYIDKIDKLILRDRSR